MTSCLPSETGVSTSGLVVRISGAAEGGVGGRPSKGGYFSSPLFPTLLFPMLEVRNPSLTGAMRGLDIQKLDLNTLIGRHAHHMAFNGEVLVGFLSMASK